MSHHDQSSPPDVDPTRQLRAYLDALRANGVEWVARNSAPPLPSVESPGKAAEPEPVAPTGSLFEESPEVLPVVPADQRQQELDLLYEQISGCRRCAELAAARRNTVPGVGPIDPELCFVGEAPGADEDRQGEPFVGAAGQLLNKMIAACGFRREDIYICNIIKCRPPANRDPRPEEAANCREYLDRQLDLVRPKFICALGRIAAQNLLGVTAPLGRLRKRVHQVRGIPVICTYHPAALLRNPQWKKDAWEDLKMMLTEMGKPIPGGK